MSEFAQQHGKPGTKLVGARNDLASGVLVRPKADLAVWLPATAGTRQMGGLFDRVP
jgi:hypothetical protein